MKKEKEQNKHIEDACSLTHGVMDMRKVTTKHADAEPQKEAVIIDIKKVLGPRKSYIPIRSPSIDHFDSGFLEDEGEMMPPHWAVPWSDIMMVVFVMFAVLFIHSISKHDVANAFRAPTEGKTVIANQKDVPEMIPEQFRELSTRLTKYNGPNDVSVALDKNQLIKVSASDSLFFNPGKADIKPEAIEFLKNFAEIVRKTKSNIRIEGHTDSSPIHSPDYPTNWELSATRAVTITRYLIEKAGLEPERFTVVGHSLYKPAVPGSTYDSKAKNRRVEIFVDDK